MPKDECTFCIEFLNEDDCEFRRIFPRSVLPSRIIKSSKNFICLAAIGALREGYLLILPKYHYTSFAFLPPSLANEVQEFKGKIVNNVTEVFSTPIVFEHGVIDINTSTAGGCIDHAHFHIFPSQANLFPKLSEQFPNKIISHVNDLSAFGKERQPYLYYEKEGKGFAFIVNRDLPSQYMRRLIMEEEGRPDEWDWSVYIGKDHVIKTVEMLREIGI